MSLRKASILLLLLMFFAPQAWAELIVTMHKVDKTGVGSEIGTIKVTETSHGLVFTPDLKNLSHGLHGFHAHEHPSCQPSKDGDERTAAGAAGSHYDPYESGYHGAPWGEGHLGVLPALYADEDERATHPVLAPRMTMEHLQGRALIIHEDGDNYSDHPEPLGGGGDRIACGIVPSDDPS